MAANSLAEGEKFKTHHFTQNACLQMLTVLLTEILSSIRTNTYSHSCYSLVTIFLSDYIP